MDDKYLKTKHRAILARRLAFLESAPPGLPGGGWRAAEAAALRALLEEARPFPGPTKKAPQAWRHFGTDVY